MLNWRAVHTISELKLFQIAFRELSEDDKAAITAEMIIYVQEYQDAVTINGETQKNLAMPRQVEPERIYKKRRSRVSRLR